MAPNVISTQPSAPSMPAATGPRRCRRPISSSLRLPLIRFIRSQRRAAACVSFNYHRDHFRTTWDIRDANGEPAHTGCVAFGMDRLAVAMFHTHGTDLAKWPVEVRKILELR